MKTLAYLQSIFFLLSFTTASAQHGASDSIQSPLRNISIEPAIGVHPWPMSDVVFSNLVQWNVHKRLSFIAHSSYAYNNAFIREFNYIKTNYNFTLSEKIGIGTSFYTERSAHTFSILGGIKYDAFKETLENPEFETVSASVSSLSPDFGLMYNWKRGKGKYFFSYRMYIPLYPYPINSTDTWSIDGNLANFSMEFGLGIRLK